MNDSYKQLRTYDQEQITEGSPQKQASSRQQQQSAAKLCTQKDKVSPLKEALVYADQIKY